MTGGDALQASTAVPFDEIAIGSNGSVDVTLHTGSDVQQVCASPIATGLVPPITVTVIAPDGRSKTARIEIETVVAVELGRIEISALRLGDDAGNKSRS